MLRTIELADETFRLEIANKFILPSSVDLRKYFCRKLILPIVPTDVCLFRKYIFVVEASFLPEFLVLCLLSISPPSTERKVLLMTQYDYLLHSSSSFMLIRPSVHLSVFICSFVIRGYIVL